MWPSILITVSRKLKSIPPGSRHYTIAIDMFGFYSHACSWVLLRKSLESKKMLTQHYSKMVECKHGNGLLPYTMSSKF